VIPPWWSVPVPFKRNGGKRNGGRARSLAAPDAPVSPKPVDYPRHAPNQRLQRLGRLLSGDTDKLYGIIIMTDIPTKA